MSRSLITVREVAAGLHVSAREVVRMADEGILPAVRVKGAWHFRAGEIWNWIEANLQVLPSQRARDPHPAQPGDPLLAPVLNTSAISVSLKAKTKASVIRELAALAERFDSTLDVQALVEAVTEREAQGSTALQDGVAVPHPARPFYSEGPIIAAARTAQGVIFGERGGGLTDLFFLVCCPQQVEHLLYLGRLCRLLIDKKLQIRLRSAADANSFADALREAEAALCKSA